MTTKGPRSGREQRHRQILDELRIKPAVRVLEIARRLGVHVETIRRDLSELQNSGKISRTYGSALPLSTGVEPSVDERDRLLIAERTRIAERAAELVHVGDVLMIDVGATTLHFARSLAARNCDIRIITNNWKLVGAIAAASEITTILCPGEYSQKQGGVAGPDTTDFLHKFHADKAVLSVGGLCVDGLYEYEPNFAWVKRAMLDHSQVRILIVDHSKFGRKVMTRICGLDAIDHIVVDQAPEGALLEQIAAHGVKLHVAAET